MICLKEGNKIQMSGCLSVRHLVCPPSTQTTSCLLSVERIFCQKQHKSTLTFFSCATQLCPTEAQTQTPGGVLSCLGSGLWVVWGSVDQACFVASHSLDATQIYFCHAHNSTAASRCFYFVR